MEAHAPAPARGRRRRRRPRPLRHRALPQRAIAQGVARRVPRSRPAAGGARGHPPALRGPAPRGRRVVLPGAPARRPAHDGRPPLRTRRRGRRPRVGQRLRPSRRSGAWALPRARRQRDRERSPLHGPGRAPTGGDPDPRVPGRHPLRRGALLAAAMAAAPGSGRRPRGAPVPRHASGRSVPSCLSVERSAVHQRGLPAGDARPALAHAHPEGARRPSRRRDGDEPRRLHDRAAGDRRAHAGLRGPARPPRVARRLRRRRRTLRRRRPRAPQPARRPRRRARRREPARPPAAGAERPHRRGGRRGRSHHARRARREARRAPRLPPRGLPRGSPAAGRTRRGLRADRAAVPRRTSDVTRPLTPRADRSGTTRCACCRR